MPRPTWPPKYVNIQIPVLLETGVSHGAFRFYCKLKALSWGEPSLTLPMETLMHHTGVRQSQVYEYARSLRDHHGLLSYDVRNDAFECSFPDLAEIPVFPEKPIKSLGLVKPKTKTTEEEKANSGKSGNSGNAGIQPAPVTTRQITDAYCELLGFKPDNWAEGESAAAKRIAAGFTVEQLGEAYQHFKATPYYSDKRLPLRWLVGQMPDYFAAKKAGRLNGNRAVAQRLPDGV